MRPVAQANREAVCRLTGSYSSGRLSGKACSRLLGLPLPSCGYASQNAST